MRFLLVSLSLTLLITLAACDQVDPLYSESENLPKEPVASTEPAIVVKEVSQVINSSDMVSESESPKPPQVSETVEVIEPTVIDNAISDNSFNNDNITSAAGSSDMTREAKGNFNISFSGKASTVGNIDGSSESDVKQKTDIRN